MDENGMTVHDASDAPTFSNLNPNTSDADVLGGNSARYVWGTNVSVDDTLYAVKDFLQNFQRKYRLIQDGELEEGASLPPNDPAMAREYVEVMKTMLELGVMPLNLDARNLKAYPPTRKLWHQLQAYPREIIPLMDHAIKDIMIELAEKRMAEMRVQASQAQRSVQGRDRDSSPLPPVDIPDLVKEVDQKMYRVRPFALDHTINLRELNPGDMDKLVSIKGLVIRTTPIIPDMKDGACGISSQCSIANLIQPSFVALSVIIPSEWILTVARSLSPPAARVPSASHPTRWRSSTTDLASPTSKSLSCRKRLI